MSTKVMPIERAITQDQLNAYADASGDHNPIHIDPAFAATTPFGSTIAHGMLVLALIGDVMYAAHGAAWSTSGRLKVRFKAPARPGDTVTASAELNKQMEDSVEYAVQCVNQRGEILIEGRASVSVA